MSNGGERERERRLSPRVAIAIGNCARAPRRNRQLFLRRSVVRSINNPLGIDKHISTSRNTCEQSRPFLKSLEHGEASPLDRPPPSRPPAKAAHKSNPFAAGSHEFVHVSNEVAGFHSRGVSQLSSSFQHHPDAPFAARLSLVVVLLLFLSDTAARVYTRRAVEERKKTCAGRPRYDRSDGNKKKNSPR